MSQPWRAFGSLFFLLNQDRLLWLLNAPFVGRWFRRVLCISGGASSVARRCIFRILPNAIFWWDGPYQKVEFRTHAKFSKRLYYAFAPLWWMLHAWDWALADRWAPQLSFGFDTLTKYPDADPETSTVDGYVGIHNLGVPTWDGVTWASLHDAGTGDDVGPSAVDDVAIFLRSGVASNKYMHLYRSIFLFDTSAVTSAASISAAVLSIQGTGKTDEGGWTPNVDIYLSTPASNTDIAAGDFSQLGAASQTGSPITYANWSVSGYNDFTLSSTGRGNISKTGISKFGARNAGYDVANSPPAWASDATSYLTGYFADQTGTANDPKLVVTFTHPATPSIGSGTLTGIAGRNDRGVITPTEVNIA